MCLQELSLILKQRIIIYPDQNEPNNNLEVILTENHPQAELKQVTIKKLSQNAMVLTFDKTSSDILFQSEKPNARCDYLIINDETIFFIEMKSNKNAPNAYGEDCIKKYKASKCILTYIDEVLREFHSSGQIFGNKDKRYVLLYKGTSINKSQTSLKPQANTLPNNIPENFLGLSVTNEAIINLRELSI